VGVPFPFDKIPSRIAYTRARHMGPVGIRGYAGRRGARHHAARGTTGASHDRAGEVSSEDVHVFDFIFCSVRDACAMRVSLIKRGTRYTVTILTKSTA